MASPAQIMEALVALMSSKPKVMTQENILTPAIRANDQVFEGKAGQIHPHIEEEVTDMGFIGSKDPIESGFTAPEGTFLDRQQSVRFLNEMGSLDDIPEVSGQKHLLAEDLLGVDITGSTRTGQFTDESIVDVLIKILQEK
jgi:hypothetical protein